MKEPCTEYLKRAHVPKINTPESFSIDKYIEKDVSRAKTKAAAWGAGNYKELIKMNMRPNYQPTMETAANGAVKTDGAPPTVINLPAKRDKHCYKAHRLELSEVGKRIDALCREKNITMRRMAEDLHKKQTTLTAAVRINGKYSDNTIKAIADYLGVSVEYLQSGKDE